MITDNCLVGCRPDQHHKFCDSFVKQSSINYTIEEMIDEVESFECDKKNDLKKIDYIKMLIKKYNLQKKIQSYEYIYPRYYIIAFCREELGMSFQRIIELFNRPINSIIYSIGRHNEFKNDKKYIEHTNGIRECLNKLEY